MERERKIHASMKKKLPLVIGFGGFYQPYLFKKSLFTPCTVEQLLHRVTRKRRKRDEKHLRKLFRKKPNLKGAY